MVDIYKTIGVDAVNVGELDLALGVDYLKSLAKQKDFPFISANLMDADNKPIFPRYVIKKVGDRNVGIFGLIGDTSGMPDKVKDLTDGAATVSDALKAAESVIEEISGKVDYIVALTHQTANRDWVVARRVKGVDLVVGGHDKQRLEDPQVAESTLIVRAGEKGQYQGMLEVDLAANKTAVNTLVPYGEERPADPKIKAMITTYNDKLGEIYGNIDAQSAANVDLRNEKCGTCHANQLASWKTSDHAKAYATLVGKSKQVDPKCLSCHTVRFEEPGGFNMTQQQMDMVNVQCESCHGDATAHLSNFQKDSIPMRKPPIKMCVKCHTADRCPTFIKDEKIVMGKIKH